MCRSGSYSHSYSHSYSRPSSRSYKRFGLLLRRRVDKSGPAFATFQKMIDLGRLGDGVDFFLGNDETYFPNGVICPGNPFQ